MMLMRLFPSVACALREVRSILLSLYSSTGNGDTAMPRGGRAGRIMAARDMPS